MRDASEYMLHHVLFFIFAVIAWRARSTCCCRASHQQRAVADRGDGLAGGAYLLLGAEFVAAVQVIVYAGAIMVLFVFVIMLLNAGAEERHQRQPDCDCARRARRAGAGRVLVAWVLIQRTTLARSDQRRRLWRTTQDIGQLLFRDFLLPFEVTSVLILIAIMGAVVLAQGGRS